MNIATVPLDTWMVVEPIAHHEIKVLSTHATQEEAECDRRNKAARTPRCSACFALEPVAAGMGRAPG